MTRRLKVEIGTGAFLALLSEFLLRFLPAAAASSGYFEPGYVEPGYIAAPHFSTLQPLLTLTLYAGLWIFGAGIGQALRKRRLPNSELQSGIVKRAPGNWMLFLAEFFYSPRVASYLSEIVNDMRIEYWAALQDGRTVKAKWIRLRGCWSFFKAAILQPVLSLARMIADIWKIL